MALSCRPTHAPSALAKAVSDSSSCELARVYKLIRVTVGPIRVSGKGQSKLSYARTKSS